MDNNKKGIVIVIIGLLITGIIVYFAFFNNRVSSYSEWFNVEKTSHSVNILEYNGSLHFESSLSKNEKESSQVKHTYYCRSIRCSGQNLLNGASYAIIKDGKNYVIYNYKDNFYRYLDIGSNVNYVDVLYYDNIAYGAIVGNDNDKYAIYSFEENKLISDYVYDDYLNGEATLANNTVIVIDEIVENNANYNIVNLSDGTIALTMEGVYSIDMKMISKSKNGYHYYLIPSEAKYGFEYELYNDSFSLITTVDYGFLEVLNNGNAVVQTSENSFKSYDHSGNFRGESRNYKSVIMLCDKYAFIVDNDDLIKIIDYNGNTIKVLTSYSEHFYFRTDQSGWYNENGVDLLCLIIEDDSLEDSNGIKYLYNPTTGRLDYNIF